ncbi:Serine/threonine-protein phosphatase 2A regulatory subunit B'' subunit beta [Gryllus bimaculatus]|nr:Serine/threonine-protein phosphatase 2A regulatory subunit B'' subunit beta [Gryllus bimaculatus]
MDDAGAPEGRIGPTTQNSDGIEDHFHSWNYYRVRGANPDLSPVTNPPCSKTGVVTPRVPDVAVRREGEPRERACRAGRGRCAGVARALRRVRARCGSVRRTRAPAAFPYRPPRLRRPRSYQPGYARARAPLSLVTNYARGGAKESARPSAQAHAQTPTQPQLPPNTTLQRHVRAHRNLHIPRFYFPKGKPSADQQQGDQLLQRVAAAFRALPNQQAPRDAFHDVVKACDCPLYWKIPLFIAAGGEKLGYVEANSFIEFWKTMSSTCHDAAAQFFYILSKGQMRDLTTEDFIPMVQDVVDTHPGLTFLKEATEFHSRYVHTVITRIFYCVNRSWSGKISLPELRRSDLLRIIRLLEEEEDINQVTAYFSYEHFYVIYCKFWELDRDHDLYIDRQDLARHSDHALSTRMIDRIFSGAVTRGGRHQEEKMSYTDFVWFLLSEEDKRHPTAIEYWFRCMDLDGDGYLSMYELEYFYEEQLQRMDAIGIETLPFEDCLCQLSDWDRYAADEYELLVAEEGGNDQQDDQLLDDEMAFDNNADDALSPNLDILVRNGTSSSMVMELDLEEDGCTEESPSSSTWRNNFNIDTDEVDEDSDNSADYAADSDECPV